MPELILRVQFLDKIGEAIYTLSKGWGEDPVQYPIAVGRI